LLKPASHRLRGRESIAWLTGQHKLCHILSQCFSGKHRHPGGILYQENPKYKELPPPLEDEIAGRQSPSEFGFPGTDNFCCRNRDEPDTRILIGTVLTQSRWPWVSIAILIWWLQYRTMGQALKSYFLCSHLSFISERPCMRIWFAVHHLSGGVGLRSLSPWVRFAEVRIKQLWSSLLGR